MTDEQSATGKRQMKIHGNRAYVRALCAAGSAISLTAALSGAASAQEAASIGEVVVTASRIQAAGFTAPTPTSVVGQAELTRRAAVSIQETLAELPSMRNNTSPQQGSSGINGANSGTGTSLADLHGLGTQRTLTLIDGRRAGGTSDLRQIPTVMVSRIDTVTGGASAAYGSDAVGGVINIILDTKFSGLKGNLQWQQTKYGDDKGPSGSLVWGGDIGSKAHLLIGGDYYATNGAHTSLTDIRQDKRPWFAANRALNLANPCPLNVAVSAACPTGGNGLPYFIDTDNMNFSTMAVGGVITAGPLKGITFDDGGVPRQFQYGQVIGNSMLGGNDGVNPTVWWSRPYERRYNLLGHLDYQLTDKVHAWVEYANTGSHNKVNFQHARDQANLTIQRDNAFLPASIRAEMVRLNLNTLTMGRINNDGGGFSHVYNNIFRYAGGLDGEFDALGKSWGWDGYFQYGKAHTYYITENSRNQSRWQFALDSVLNAQGVPVCRAAQAGNVNAAGCVPFNIFGPNASSQAARNYVFGNQSGNNDRAQYSAQLNIHGEPFRTWAGPVAMAAGVEYRKETINVTADPIAQISGWESGNIRALSGQYSVKEGYLELGVPLAKDMAFAKSLDLSVAGRYADYSSVGAVSTYKIGATWRPIDELLLRTSYSKDVRAPNVSELFVPSSVNNNGFTQFSGPRAGTTTIIQFVSAGNPNLRAEKGKTWAIGGTFSPRFTRLRFSADYYDIKMTDQIGAVGVQVVGDLCKAGRQDFCSLITFDSTQTVTSILNANVNNNAFRVRGLDLEATYTLPLNELPLGFDLPGTLTGRALATKTFEFATTTVGGYENKVGQIPSGVLAQEPPNMPHWLATYSLAYNVGRFTGQVSFKYLSAGFIESQSVTGTTTSRLNNKLPNQTITNLNLAYQLIDSGGRKLQLYGVVNNMFNRGPSFPVFPVTNWASNYDTLGTQFRAGIRFQY